MTEPPCARGDCTTESGILVRTTNDSDALWCEGCVSDYAGLCDDCGLHYQHVMATETIMDLWDEGLFLDSKSNPDRCVPCERSAVSKLNEEGDL